MRKPSVISTKAVTLLLTLLLAFFLAQARASDAAQPGTILVIGDSLSAAYGIDVDEGWVALLERRLAAEGYHATVINSSVSGDTSANGLSRLPSLLSDYKPAIVVIELGGNDGLRGLSLKQLRSNLTQMAELSKAAGADVLILGVQIPSNYGAAYTKLFTRTFAQVAEEADTALVPSFMSGMETAPELFQDDGIHPAAGAQTLLLDNTWVELKPLLDKVFQ
jgi:acyl-CoA thioesterase-1